MKKALSLILALAMMFTLCACGGVTENTPKTVAENTPKNPVLKERLTQLTAENTLVIEGDEYALPFIAQELVDAGWSGAFSDYAFAPGEGGTYPYFPLRKDEKIKIKGAGFFNHSDKSKPLDKCAVTSLTLIANSKEDSKDSCSFTLPGGITEKSTYYEVSAAHYPNCEIVTNQTIGTDCVDSIIVRPRDDSSVPYKYTFYFNADQSIKTVEIESTDYKSAALTAFEK